MSEIHKTQAPTEHNAFVQKISDLLFEKPGVVIGHCAIVNIPGLFSSRTMQRSTGPATY